MKTQPFTEPPPKPGCENWADKFTQWWFRKCKHHGVDPVEAFGMMLSDLIEIPTEDEVERFIKEFNEGLHPLSAEDEAALEKAKEKLMQRIRKQ